MRKALAFITALTLLVAASCHDAAAQFRSEAFTQNYNDNSTNPNDTTDHLFSFKEYFGALGHKNEMQIGTMAAGSAIFIGGCQIYNKQYWKLPIVYGGIAAGIAGGIYHNKKGNTTLSTAAYITAGAFWWGSLLDGAISFKSDKYPLPGRSTLYSILIPGLGQAYNGEYWKIPIYWGCLAGAGHYWYVNKTNFEKYRRIYIEAQDPEYSGPISSETAVYYRDVYRRYRDYSVLALAAFYLIQVIDANVFAYMHDFNISDDITVSLEPSVIQPENYQFAMRDNRPNAYGIGLKMNF